ncbi:MAG TPA: AAA family ATPase [Nitrospirota bacterium]
MNVKRRCPAHEDKVASLSVKNAGDRLLLNCHAGCTQDEIWKALEQPDIHSVDTEPDKGTGELEATYDYFDEAGSLVYQKLRFRPKAFFIRRVGKANTPLLPSLYRLPELLKSGDRVVFYVEGEKDVDTLTEAGFVATTAGGATSWSPALSKFFEGRRVVIIPDADAPGVKLAETVLGSISEVAECAVILRLGGKDATEWLSNGGSPDQLKQLARDAVLASGQIPVPVGEVKREDVKWLWRSFIPFGKITIIEGDPGLGKSTLSLELVSRASRGNALPVSGPIPACNSLILASEDSVADTIRPRLEAANADSERVFISQAPVYLDKHLAKIRAWIRSVDAKILVIDPLAAYLSSGVDSYRDTDIRRTLGPVGRLADELGVAVILVRHLVKQGQQPIQKLYRGVGSIGTIGAARSCILVSQDADDSDLRKVELVKSNLAPPTMDLFFRLKNPGPSIEWQQV